MSAEEERALLKHDLAAIAYRTQKALRGAPGNYGADQPMPARPDAHWPERPD